jgi:hypothetical protein
MSAPDFAYIEQPDVAPGVTLAQYRRANAHPRRRFLPLLLPVAPIVATVVSLRAARR